MAPRSRQVLEAAVVQVVAEQLAAAVVVVDDEQRPPVGPPVDRHLALEVEGHLGDPIGGDVPDERAWQIAPVVHDEQPAVTGGGCPLDRLEAPARAVPQLGDGGAVGREDPQRGVAGVAVLGVGQGHERAVGRERTDAGRLPMGVHGDRLPDRAVGPQRDPVDVRAVVVGDADQGEIVADGDATGVADRPGLDAHRLATGERLAAPTAALVTVVVVEPPDVLAARVEQPVRRPVRAIGELADPARRPVPRVQLDHAAGVRPEQRAVGAVAGPPRHRGARCPEPLSPRGLLRFGARCGDGATEETVTVVDRHDLTRRDPVRGAQRERAASLNVAGTGVPCAAGLHEDGRPVGGLAVDEAPPRHGDAVAEEVVAPAEHHRRRGRAARRRRTGARRRRRRARGAGRS